MKVFVAALLSCYTYGCVSLFEPDDINDIEFLRGSDAEVHIENANSLAKKAFAKRKSLRSFRSDDYVKYVRRKNMRSKEVYGELYRAHVAVGYYLKDSTTIDGLPRDFTVIIFEDTGESNLLW